METNDNTQAEKNKRGRPRKDVTPDADWLTVIEAMRAEARIVVRCWYPESRGELFDVGSGVNAEILIGNPAYQVSSGEIVAV